RQTTELSDEEYGFSVNIADIQRMHLRILQGRVNWLALSAGFGENYGIDDGVPHELGSALHEYDLTYACFNVPLIVQAVRDHEYMCQFSEERNDPFKISSERSLDRQMLYQAMRHKLKPLGLFQYLKPTATPTGPWEDGQGEIRPMVGTRGEYFRRALWSRLAGALIGAVFLIGPMWLLVLEQNIFLQLGVVTGCIVIFGLLMVVWLDMLDAVFAATLAYAAVLMVFVGVVMQNLGTS
ncbi:hypothetical protein BD289DRAFT_361612, partial [Coniella lustricola]